MFVIDSGENDTQIGVMSGARLDAAVRADSASSHARDS